MGMQSTQSTIDLILPVPWVQLAMTVRSGEPWATIFMQFAGAQLTTFGLKAKKCISHISTGHSGPVDAAILNIFVTVDACMGVE